MRKIQCRGFDDYSAEHLAHHGGRSTSAISPVRQKFCKSGKIVALHPSVIAQPPRYSALVVEDDPGIRALLRVLLEREGFAVHQLGDGEDASRKILEGSYSVVLLDLMMPVTSGFEVIAKIKELDEAQLKRIIVFTAAAESTLKRFANADLVWGVVRKPFDLQRILETVRACVQAQSISQSA